MIVTCTPNPSIDRTVEVEQLTVGAVQRASSVRVDPAGKGVNVSRALVRNAVQTTAVLPVGGNEGDHLLALLRDALTRVADVPIAGSIRVNLTIAESDGTVTKVNAPGPDLDDAEVDALVTAVGTATEGAAWLACCGSLPGGAPTDLYARLAEEARAHGAAVAVDTSGDAFTAALRATPDLVTPNEHELAELVGTPVRTVGDAADAARSVAETHGVRSVLVTLGGAGALLVQDDAVWHGTTTAVDVRSTVGAGDSSLAGFLAAGAEGPEALASALTWGAAAVQLPGSRVPGPNDLDPDLVRIGDAVDRDRPLRGE